MIYKNQQNFIYYAKESLKHHADTKTRKIAYFSLVRLTQEYSFESIELWDSFSKNYYIKRLEKNLKSALRCILKLKCQVSFREIRENTGIKSLAKRRKNLRFKYYLNALNKDLSVSDFGSFKKCHNTWQQRDSFVPSIRTNALSYYFWTR